MKRILLVIILMLPIIAHAQTVPIDSATNKVLYTEVIKVDGVLKDELYTRAREWFAKTFRSAQSVLQMDDKDAGKIIGKGAASSSFKYMIASIDFLLKYTISIAVKDGRYRYEITDISVHDQSSLGYHLTLDDIVVKGASGLEKTKKANGEYRSRFKGYVIQSDILINELLADLKKTMYSKSKDDF